MKLLIVEDNELMRCLIKSVVHDIVETIDECSNGAEAVAAFAMHGHDWVLMDIEMAEMDGLTATAKIIAADPRARIVIVTEHDDKHLREAAVEAGAIAFIAKENLLDVRALLAPGARKDLTEH